MLGGYNTLATVGAILGVSEQRVLELCEHGPLVAVRREAGVMIHDEDLAAFRRPLFATSGDNSPPRGSEVLQFANPANAGVVSATTENDSLIMRPCGADRKRIAAGRNTMASAGFRALQDLTLVDAASDRFDRLTTPEPNTGCLLWVGAMDRKSYGYFRLTTDQVVFSHRFAFVRAHRHIEERAEVDHLCHNRWCVLDRHLEAVSKQENLRRRDAHRAELGLPDNCAIARATVAARHLRLVR